MIQTVEDKIKATRNRFGDIARDLACLHPSNLSHHRNRMADNVETICNDLDWIEKYHRQLLDACRSLTLACESVDLDGLGFSSKRIQKANQAINNNLGIFGKETPANE